MSASGLSLELESGGRLMRQMKTMMIALVVAAAAALPASARAQELNASERTLMTFSAPVELPGVTLPAGDYIFRLADTPGRNVIQVWDEDQEKILGQWLFVPTQRTRTPEETVVMFRETPAGTPPAVRYWYFPGEAIGKEFVYPKDQGTKIAARTGETVLTTEGEISASSAIASVDSKGNVTARTEGLAEPPSQSAAQAPATPPAPTTQPAPAPPAPSAAAPAPRPAPAAQPAAPEPARPAPAPPTSAAAPRPASAPPAAAADTQTPRTELPRTSSAVPLVALLGLLSLGAGVILRRVR
jgi:hypothetical protein